MAKKKRPLVKLVVSDIKDENPAVTFTSLVDHPAIESDWMAFGKQTFVEPQKGESESDFMKRCVPYMMDEGKEQDQAVAACMTMYKGSQQGFEFKVASEERRIITGAAMIPDKPIYRRDERGEYDVIFDSDTIEQAVKKWGKFGYHNKVNIMHSPDMKPDGVYLIESFIVDSKRGITAPSCLKEKFPDGTWIQSYYVENDAVWELVKQGKIKGFSVEGLFAMEEAFARFKKTEQDDNEKYLSEIESIAKKVTR